MSSISVITTAKNMGSGIQDKLRKMWGLILKQVGKIKGSVQMLLGNATSGVTVPLTFVGHIDRTTIEVHAVSSSTTASGRRPVAAVRATAVVRRNVEATVNAEPRTGGKLGMSIISTKQSLIF